MVPSRYASTDELVELARVAGEFEGTSTRGHPAGRTHFDQWAVELMTDMSVAAQRPINWNVMSVNAGQPRTSAWPSSTAGDDARAKGGKVVALTIPMSFGARFSFDSGFVLDAMPGWEDAMPPPRDEKMRLFDDRAARDALERARHNRPDNPMRTLANWGTKIIFDVVAPENEQYRGQHGRRDRQPTEGRDAWDVLCDIAVADELNTSFGTPVPARDGRRLEGSIAGVARLAKR